MFCSNCGKELNENDQFCGNCGHKVNNSKDKNVISDNNIDTNNSSEVSTINTSNNTTTNANSFEYTNVTNNDNSNTNNQFAKVVITRLEGSKLFNKTPMKVIYNGSIITKIVAGEVLELELPVGQHSVIFDGNGDILDYTINVEKANSMIYIDISLISELSHSSGIPKIQSERTENNIIPSNAKYKFSYNEILNCGNNPQNNISNDMGMYGIISIVCIIVGLFVMGYAMSFCAIGFGFLGLRRSKVLKNEKGDILSLIGIIGGFIELGVMLSHTFTF